MKYRVQNGAPVSKCETYTMDSTARARGWTIVSRLAILLLLVGLTGLATTAKDGQYHRASNLEHQSSLATKMNVPQAPVILGSTELQKVARLMATKPRQAVRARLRAEPLPMESVGVTVSMQHRSPPVTL